MPLTKQFFISLGLLAFSVPSWATGKTTGTFGATTNYLWRGVTYSDNQPAIQGGLDYQYKKRSHDVSVGTWVSSSQSYGDGLEANLYGQYSYRLSYDYSLHFGAKTLHYPHNISTDYGHYWLGMAWNNLTVNVEQWSHDSFGHDIQFTRGRLGIRLVGENNFFGTTSRYHYSEITRTFEIDEDWELGLLVGYSTFDKNALAGYSDHYNYTVSVNRQIDQFTTTMFLADTNRKDPSTNQNVEDRTVGLSFLRTF